MSREDLDSVVYKRICVLHGMSLLVIEGIDNLEGDFPSVWTQGLKGKGNMFRDELIKATNKFTPPSKDEERSLNDIQNVLHDMFSGMELKIVKRLWEK